jgi:hypothetical protein
MSRLNSGLAPGLEEFLNSGVPKALDHPLSVAPHAHPVQSPNPTTGRAPLDEASASLAMQTIQFSVNQIDRR